MAKEVWPATDNEEEAESGPATLRLAAMEEEPEEMKPARKEDKEEKKEVPATLKVEEAESGPATFRLAATEEEAEEMKPPVKVARLVTVSVLERLAPPVTAKFKAWMVPVAKIPPTVVVPEIRALP